MKRCYANIIIWSIDKEDFNEAVEVLEQSMRNLDTHEEKLESENLDLTSPYYSIKGYIQYDGRNEEQMEDDARENAMEEKSDDKRKYNEH